MSFDAFDNSSTQAVSDPQAPRKILLVDEHPLAHQLIVKYLDEAELSLFHVDYAQSFSEGTAALIENEYDVCLVDFKLGRKKTGLDFIRLAEGKQSSPPVILILPEEDPELEHKALDAGAADLLIRGHFDARSLGRAVRFAIERAKRKRLLNRTAQFRNLIAGISTSFINCPYEEIDNAIENALEIIGAFAGADRGFVVLMTEDGKNMHLSHEWNYKGLSSIKEFYNSRAEELFSPLINFINRTKVSVVRCADELPEDAANLKNVLRERNIKSMAVLPLQSFEKRLGFFGFAKIGREMAWNSEMTSLLELAGQVFVNAIEFKRKDADLRASERKFRRYFEMPLIGIALSSIDKKWLEVNDKLCEMLGYERHELTSKSWTEFTHPDDLSRSEEHFQQALSGKIDTYSFDKRFIRKDGSLFYAELSAGCVRNRKKDLEYFVVVVEDISDRKKAHDVLIEQQDYLRQILDTIPHPVFARDRTNTYTLANKAFAAGYGLKPEEVMGLRNDQLISDQDEIRRFIDQDQEVFETGKTVVVEENPAYMASQGKLRWFKTIKEPLRSVDGTIIQMVGISTDHTEKKRAEDMLKAVLEGTATATAENFFRSLVYHLGSVMKCKCTFISQISEEDPNIAETIAVFQDNEFKENCTYPIPGSPTEKVFGKTLQYYPENVGTLFPEDAYLQEQKIQAYIGVPIFDSVGRPLGILGVMDDKSVPEWEPAKWLLAIFAARAGAELERVHSEEETLRLQKQLMHSQKMEVIGQLAAGLAHDLNNSLGAVVGHLHLIKMQATQGSSNAKSADVALTGCERASSLVEQLLGFSRKKKYNLQELSLTQLISQTLKLLSSVINRDTVVKTIEFTEDLAVQADSDQLQQALVNVILNSNQAMPEGGILTFSYRVEYIDDAKCYNSSASARNYIILSISDTGCGISDEHIDRIFEPFFTTKDVSKGTGLGLPMAYNIIQNHGGWMSVNSKVGLGTTFKVYLPEVTDQDKTSPKPKRRTKRKVKKVAKNTISVLVIDDEKPLVELCEIFLQKAGFSSFGFTSPEKALDWFEEHHSEVDLTILDMKMPNISGEACYDRIKKIDPHAEVIIFSGFLQSDLEHKLLKKGALKFFKKPIKYPELINWVSKHFKESNGQDPEK